LASFYAYDFIFDGTPSQNFDLKIISFDDGGLFSSMGSGDVNIITQRVLRKAKPYYLGRTQEPVLSFNLTFGRKDTISGYDNDAISKWLFGRSTYKQLYILQDDLDGAYFNCFLRNPQKLSIGGIQYAFECTVVCDSPFAYLPQKTISASYVDLTDLEYTTTIYNASSEDDYLYPQMYFQMGTSGSTVSFTNITDDSNTSTWGISGSPLSQDEEMFVDNDLQLITSSSTTGLPRISHFNKNWFRLLPGPNEITVSGSVAWFQINYTERKKLGG
jgi:phage-related protein